jgi:hypothetical protein
MTTLSDLAETIWLGREEAADVQEGSHEDSLSRCSP